MGEVVAIDGGVPEKKPPTAGQALFAAIVDEFDRFGARLPRAVVAVAAKKGAEALADGVEPRIVLAGCIAAIQQGKQRFTTEIIADIAVADIGMYRTATQHRGELVQHSQSNDSTMQRMLGMMRSQRDAANVLKLTRGVQE
jgi:hypothetical protein